MAKDSINAIIVIGRLAVSESHLRQDSAVRFATSVAKLIGDYLYIKQRIPATSKWFAQAVQHKTWYLADSTTMALASNAATFLQPELIVDRKQVEDELLDVFFDMFRSGLKENAPNVVVSFCSILTELAEKFGSRWEVGYFNSKVRDILQDVLGYARSNDAKEDYLVTLADTLGLLPINFLLGVVKSLGELNTDALSVRFERLNWRKSASIYQLNLPVGSLSQLEWLQQRLKTELLVENKAVSAKWYVQEISFKGIAQSLHDQVTSLLAIHVTYIEWANLLKEKDNWFVAATILTRGLEYSNKLEYHLAMIRDTASRLAAYHKLKGLAWPEWNWDEIDARLQNTEIEIQEQLAKLIPKLGFLDRPDTYPDFLGYAVHSTGEACYDALVTGDVTTFQKLFPSYFVGILISVQNISHIVIETQQTDPSLWVAEPLMDLVYLCGYALVYAEMHHQPDLWTLCVNKWQEYLDGRDDKEPFLESLAQIIKHSKRHFGITPRTIHRTGWHQKLEKVLSTLPTVVENDGGTFFHQSTRVDHDSPYIQALEYQEHYGTFQHGDDIFISIFLQPLNPMLDFGGDRDYASAVAREQGREDVDETTKV